MRRILLLTLLGALVLRVVGVRFGLPFDVMGDEFVHIYTAFTFMSEMTLRALSPMSYVPSLFAILTIPFFAAVGVGGMALGVFEGLSGFREFAVMYSTDFISIGRVISALFGVALVYILYRLALPLAGRGPALLVAVLAALDFWMVHESNKAHFWIPATALLALAMYYLLRVAEWGRLKDYLLSATTIALGVWMGFFPIVLAPFLVLAHLHAPARRLKNLLISGGVLVLAIGVIGWLNPLSIMRQFGRALRSALNVFGIDVFPHFEGPSDNATEPLQNLYFLFDTVFWDNPFVFVLGIAGLVLMLYKLGYRSYSTQLILGLFVVYFGLATFIWPHPDHRYILPLIIPLLLGVAYLSAYVYKEFRYKSWMPALRYTAIAFLIGYSAYVTLPYTALLLKPDTRVLARDWIVAEVPAGARIFTDVQYFELPKSREAINFYAANLPEVLRTKDRLAVEFTEDKFPQPSYFVIDNRYAEQLGAVAQRYEYLVVGFYDIQYRKEVPSGFELAATFYPADKDVVLSDLLLGPKTIVGAAVAVSHLGPHIEIWKRVE